MRNYTQKKKIRKEKSHRKNKKKNNFLYSGYNNKHKKLQQTTKYSKILNKILTKQVFIK